MRKITLLLFLLAVACTRIPETGRNTLILTSPRSENQLGKEGYKEVLQKSKLNRDPRWNEILQRVGSRIAAQTGHRDFQWEFNLIESKEKNAWCMPGGKVAVYTGILPDMKDEAGMATVLGHEVAHATLRHAGQRISQQMLLTMGLSIAEVSLSNQKHRPLLMGLLGAGATVGLMLPYSRSHETEADVVGLKYMAKAGYDPAASIEFWKRFGKEGGGPPEFLSTHPGSDTRIAQLTTEMLQARQWYESSPEKWGMGEKF